MPTMTRNQTVELALGRIFRLLSRPEQPGDVAEYERCRAIVLAEIGDGYTPPYRPNWAAERHGALMRGDC